MVKGRNVPAGATILELAIVLCLMAVMTAAALPPIARLVDAARVASAATEIYALYSMARHSALQRAELVTVAVDTATGRVTVASAHDTIRVRDVGEAHGVSIGANRPSSSYSALGVGYGASNMTIVVSRGAAADTLSVSRLGRVRR